MKNKLNSSDYKQIILLLVVSSVATYYCLPYLEMFGAFIYNIQVDLINDSLSEMSSLMNKPKPEPTFFTPLIDFITNETFWRLVATVVCIVAVEVSIGAIILASKNNQCKSKEHD